MATTRSGLTAAQLYPEGSSGNAVHCMFNPNKYTLSMTNNFQIKGMDGLNYTMESDESSVSPRELALGELWFDGVEGNDDDVRRVTGKLMEFAQMRERNWKKPKPPASPDGSPPPEGPELKPPPAKFVFKWGVFQFNGVIKSLTIDYVLFTQDGTPIRAKANLKMAEYRQEDAWPGQNPTSGGGPTERIWRVASGQRIDGIAAEVYGDATRWRRIAEHNDIEDPFALRAGMTLAIPSY